MSVSRGYYLDRHEAGRILAEHLKQWQGVPNVLVLGIPRGGVVVAAEVAEALGAPLDILPARKIGAPGNPEFALGAVAEDMVYIDEELVAGLGISGSYVEGETLRQQALSRLQGQRLRGGLPPLPIEGRTVILVDDGVATGATVQAALLALQTKSPRRRILAVPVAPPAAVERLSATADEVICPLIPEEFWAVGQFYGDFRQASDEEVIRLILRARGAERGGA